MQGNSIRRHNTMHTVHGLTGQTLVLMSMNKCICIYCPTEKLYYRLRG